LLPGSEAHSRRHESGHDIGQFGSVHRIGARAERRVTDELINAFRCPDLAGRPQPGWLRA